MKRELLDATGPGERLLLTVFLSSALIVVGLAVNLYVRQAGLVLLVAGAVGLVAGPAWILLEWRRRSGDGSGSESAPGSGSDDGSGGEDGRG
jgi:high-affinity Fe2+/Pb2+ permease